MSTARRAGTAPASIPDDTVRDASAKACRDFAAGAPPIRPIGRIMPPRAGLLPPLMQPREIGDVPIGREPGRRHRSTPGRLAARQRPDTAAARHHRLVGGAGRSGRTVPPSRPGGVGPTNWTEVRRQGVWSRLPRHCQGTSRPVGCRRATTAPLSSFRSAGRSGMPCASETQDARTARFSSAFMVGGSGRRRAASTQPRAVRRRSPRSSRPAHSHSTEFVQGISKVPSSPFSAIGAPRLGREAGPQSLVSLGGCFRQPWSPGPRSGRPGGGCCPGPPVWTGTRSRCAAASTVLGLRGQGRSRAGHAPDWRRRPSHGRPG